jgi:hypothetical protein
MGKTIKTFLSKHPNIPFLKGSLETILPEVGMSTPLIVPISENDLEDKSYKNFFARHQKSVRNDLLDIEDYSIYCTKRSQIIKNGFLPVSLERIKYLFNEIIKSDN